MKLVLLNMSLGLSSQAIGIYNPSIAKIIYTNNPEGLSNSTGLGSYATPPVRILKQEDITGNTGNTVDSQKNYGDIFNNVGSLIDTGSKFLQSDLLSTQTDAELKVRAGYDAIANSLMNVDPRIGFAMKGLGVAYDAVNLAGAKTSESIGIDPDTMNLIGGSYMGNAHEIESLQNKANKKYGLFNKSSLLKANNAINKLNLQNSRMNSIADEALDFRAIGSDIADFNTLRSEYNLNGGFDLRYNLMAKQGAKLEWTPNITNAWKPTITFLQEGGKTYRNASELTAGVNFDEFNPEDIVNYLLAHKYSPPKIIALAHRNLLGKNIIPYLKNTFPDEYLAYLNSPRNQYNYILNTFNKDYLLVAKYVPVGNPAVEEPEIINEGLHYNPEDINQINKFSELLYSLVQKPLYKDWLKTVPNDRLNDNYDLKRAYLELPFSELELWRTASLEDLLNNKYHLRSINHLDNDDYVFYKKGTEETNPEVKLETDTYHSGENGLKNTHDLVYEGDRYYYRKKKEIPSNKFGGSMNIIPEGALHKERHHLGDIGFDDKKITKKGIPVIDNEGNQLAEIELNEIIFTLEVTKKLEEGYHKFYDENTSEKEKEKLALEAGKLLWKEIIYNTDDRTGLIDTLKLGGVLK